MTVTKIVATRSEIVLHLDGVSGNLTILEKAAVVGPAKGRTIEECRREVKNNTVSLSRFNDKHDRLFSRFEVYSGQKKLDGVCYVTDFDDVAENKGPYPQPDSIKALSTSDPEDIKRLHIKQTLRNINLQEIMTCDPQPDDIAYSHDGHTYYFVRSAVEKIDADVMRATEMGMITTLILLNAPITFNSRQDKRLYAAALHPDFDWTFPDAFISAFNMETEDGMGYYGAFVEFLAERYTRSDRRYGVAPGMIVSNEVDSQYVWGNAGEKTCEEYFEEYTEALRLTWLCARKHFASYRVYVSFDHYWDGLCCDKTQPLRFYPVRTCIEYIARNSRRDGDFDWNIAHHPYPEDLGWPNFWMDRSPSFRFTTPRITFKNMEVLEAYLSQPHMCYRGAPRRIIFSEQGFNSRGDGLKALTEEWAAAGYTLAYLKARQLKTLDLFTHHAYVDNPHEFGLNLGIRRCDPDKEDHLGEYKPIYWAMADMDSDKEQERIEKARQVVGEELFEYLLHPPIDMSDWDDSEEGHYFKKGETKEDYAGM